MLAGASGAGGVPTHVGGAGGRRSRARRYRPYDPHTARDLRRKLTNSERHLLDDLYARLTYVQLRLQTIAARHHELI
jgi:hypothetical protein